MRIIGERIVLRDEPQETDNRDFFRWRNLEEWEYYDEPWTPPRDPISWEEWERRRLEQLACELKLRNTTFTGLIPYDRMPAVYDAHDIYLTATDIDNMPCSITECFAAGLPVVTTNAGGVPYIVRHEETGLMVERDDHEALAANAIRLLEDLELAAAIARRAREECEQYAWPQIKGQWLAVYRALALSDVSDEYEAAMRLFPVR